MTIIADPPHPRTGDSDDPDDPAVSHTENGTQKSTPPVTRARHDAAIDAVRAVAPHATASVVGEVVGSLDSAHQKSAAVAAVGAVDADATASVVGEVVGSLDSAHQKRAAVAAVGAVDAGATASVVGQVVGSLDSAHQKSAAVAAVGAVDADATASVVGQVVANLGEEAQKQAAEAAFRAVPREIQQELASALGAPEGRTQQVLWYIVVGTMSAAIVLFGVFAMVLALAGKGAEAPLALATTALGGIVGLVATSPGSRRHG